MKNKEKSFPFFQAEGIDVKKLTPYEKEIYRQTENEIRNFIALLQSGGAEITKLTSAEEAAYKQCWFARIVPDDKRQQAMECYCLERDGIPGYLWHVFSFEILDYIKESGAKSAFDSTAKQDAVLLANWPFGITSCRIKNISSIKADCFDVLTDVIVTDCDFEWTYVKTHEDQCGPYFHRIHRL